MGKSPTIFAHRGASGHALENSIKAFEKAIELGADGIEIDVQCSKDGQLFVFHDVNLRRLTGVNRAFHDCVAEEIKRYRLGKRFLRLFSFTKIPTIEDFLTWLASYPMPVNIELKKTIIHFPEVLRRWLIDLKLPHGSHFSSFHPELIQIVKEVRPDLEVALIVTKTFDWASLPRLDYIDAVHASKKYYKPLYLDLAQKANKPVRIYGIKGNEAFLLQPHPVVTGWITDYPEKVANKIEK